MRISTSLFNQKSLAGILDQQAALSRIQQKIASGKNIMRPSDDPIGASQVIRLNEAISLTQQYQSNSVSLVNRQILEEGALTGVEDSLIRIRELALQANNSGLVDSDRHAIAIEIGQRADEILGLANTRDSNGDYLFSGFQATTKPFTRKPDGSFSYNGDQGQRQIKISDDRTLADGDSGLEVFMSIDSGNGYFVVNDNIANSGSGIIDPGSVIDSTAYIEDIYTINFVTNSDGNTAYNVVGATTGQVIPPLPQDATLDAPEFHSDDQLLFNGIETKITGTPVSGDTFSINPAGKQDVFSVLEDLSSALMSDTLGEADLAKVLNVVTRSILNIDQAFDQMTNFRARVGARLNSAESQQQINEDFLVEIQSTLSQVEDLDMVSAITELETRSIALQAAQASYSRIMSLSLFNEL